MPQPKFDSKVKRSSFKRTSLMEYIHSKENVDHINEYVSRYNIKDTFDLLPVIQSLEGLTTDLIDGIDEKFQYFQVKSWQHAVAVDTHIKGEYLYDGNKVFESKEDYCESSCIYTRQELKEIIRKIEQIEKGIEHLDDISKAAVVYDRIKRSISYENKTNETASLYTRSLRGLISGKTVCAGYATILQHVLQRQGIECKFVSGKGHAWNNIVLNGKMYGVDLTWDAGAYHNGKKGLSSMKYFLQDPTDFMSGHKGTNNGFAYDYNNISAWSEGDKDKIKKALGFSKLQTQFNDKLDCHILERKDGSKFFVAEVESNEMENPDNPGGNKIPVYKYVYIPYRNNMLLVNDAKILCASTSLNQIEENISNYTSLSPDPGKVKFCQEMKDCFINNLMSEENIDKMINQQKSIFLGGVFKNPQTNSYYVGNGKSFFSLPTFNSSIVRNLDGQVIQKYNGEQVNAFYNYSVNPVDFSLTRNVIYSETDLFKLPKNEAKKIFDPAAMERLAFENGGYLGYISQDGSVVQDPKNLAIARNRVGIRTQ